MARKAEDAPLEISGAVNTGNNVRRGHCLRLAVGTGQAAKSPHTQNEDTRPAVLDDKAVEARITRSGGSEGQEIGVNGRHSLLLRLQKRTSLASIVPQRLHVSGTVPKPLAIVPRYRADEVTEE